MLQALAVQVWGDSVSQETTRLPWMDAAEPAHSEVQMSPGFLCPAFLPFFVWWEQTQALLLS